MLSLDLHTEDPIGPGGALICIKGVPLVHCSVKALTCVQCHKKLVFRGWFDVCQSLRMAITVRWEGGIFFLEQQLVLNFYIDSNIRI